MLKQEKLLMANFLGDDVEKVVNSEVKRAVDDAEEKVIDSAAKSIKENEVNKMLSPFNFFQGDSPILVSMPHSGTKLITGMEQRLSEQAKALPDTDWFVPELYDFLQAMNISHISANYSRYVIDLNRPVDDRPLYTSKTTGLFPDILFSDQSVFLAGQTHSETLKAQIKKQIWAPYHQKITDELIRIKDKFGYAILFDAHSIAAFVPMLFTGKLPDFNFGNNNGLACAPALLNILNKIIASTPYQQVSNGRFKGGYITRSFGKPHQQIHAIQLELSQATYLKDDCNNYQLDPEKKTQVSALLQQLFQALLTAGNPSDLNIKENR